MSKRKLLSAVEEVPCSAGAAGMSWKFVIRWMHMFHSLQELSTGVFLSMSLPERGKMMQ